MPKVYLVRNHLEISGHRGLRWQADSTSISFGSHLRSFVARGINENGVGLGENGGVISAGQGPPHAQGAVLEDYNRFLYAPSPEAGGKARDSFLSRWRKLCPAVATNLEEGGEELLPFYRFPARQHRSLQTTNAIKRLQEEFRRPVGQAQHPPEPVEGRRVKTAVLPAAGDGGLAGVLWFVRQRAGKDASDPGAVRPGRGPGHCRVADFAGLSGEDVLLIFPQKSGHCVSSPHVYGRAEMQRSGRLNL